MKKLAFKDNIKRKQIKKEEKRLFIIKQISKNLCFKKNFRLNTIEKSQNNTSRTKLSNRCIQTINKKTTNKLSKFSRMIFLKTIRSGFVSGFKKASW